MPRGSGGDLRSDGGSRTGDARSSGSGGSSALGGARATSSASPRSEGGGPSRSSVKERTHRYSWSTSYAFTDSMPGPGYKKPGKEAEFKRVMNCAANQPLKTRYYNREIAKPREQNLRNHIEHGEPLSEGGAMAGRIAKKAWNDVVKPQLEASRHDFSAYVNWVDDGFDRLNI